MHDAEVCAVTALSIFERPSTVHAQKGSLATGVFTFSDSVPSCVSLIRPEAAPLHAAVNRVSAAPNC